MKLITPESDQTVSEQTNVLPIPEVLIVAGTLYDDLMAGSIIIKSLQNSQVLHDINKKLIAEKDAMKNQLTTRLWLEYLEMVIVLQTFIKAEWTGNRQR